MTEYIEISIRLRDYNPPLDPESPHGEFNERFSGIVNDLWKLIEKHKLGFEHLRFNVKGGD